MDKTVNFTTEKLRLFKNAYRVAKFNGDPVFIFEDNEYVLDYAKYLIEFLENELKKL